MSGPEANGDDPKFKWGKKSHTGRVAEKPAYFYESFTYDGIEYFLYDSVYLHAANEPEPYIGKLLKAWEYGDPAMKRIKVVWFFRPIELQNWLGDHQPQKNELFLASGEGVGLANVNPLDRSKWFKELTWEEQMQKAQEHGKLVLLSNLDPSYNSAEVEEIIWSSFREKCKAKVLQFTSFSSPHCGQAFVIFMTREAAELVVKRLNEGCLMLSNGRPLVAAKRAPLLKENSTKFVGHLSIDKQRVINKEEWKRAVFTSHCSQPNTIEYEMALEWKLLQEQFGRCWKELYEQQGKELKGLKSRLKKE